MVNDHRIRQRRVLDFAADFPGIQAEIFTIDPVGIDKINSRDEIGELASTLHIMSNAIIKKELEKEKVINDKCP